MIQRRALLRYMASTPLLAIAGCSGVFNSPKATLPPGVHRVSLLLPLLAKTAALRTASEDFRDAALYGLRDGASSLQLDIEPHDETPESAAEAAKRAIDKGTQMLLGPLLSGAVKAVAPLASDAKVLVVAFSNDDTAAVPGSVFLLGYLPQQEARRIADYALKQNIRKFYAFLPDTPFGRRTGEAFTDAVTAQNGQVIASYYGNGRPLPDLKPAARDRARRALFIPVAEDAIRVILPHLPADRQPGMSVFGTGSWNSAKIAATPSAEGVVFAAPPPALYEAFQQRFAKTYGRAPSLQAALGYDAVRLSVALVESGAPFSAEALTRDTGFQGVSGTFRFLPTGLSERLPAICSIRKRKVRVIEPAPDRF